MADVKRGEYQTHRITLSVDAWVSAETVTDWYRALQKRKLGHQRNRKPGIKNLRLFEFVDEARAAAPKLNWKELKDGWNEHDPDNPRHTHESASHFRREYLNTKAALLRPHSRRNRSGERK